MAPRSLMDRLLSPAGFGLALLFFLLPFTTVSCVAAEGAQEVTVDYTFTGLDLATGGAPEIGGTVIGDDGSPMQVDGVTDEAGFRQEFGRPVQPLAAVAAVVLLVGMVGAFALPAAVRGRLTAATALAGVVLLAVEVFAVVPARAADELAARGPTGPVSTHTTPAIGFYLAVAVLLALVVLEFVRVRRPTLAGGPPAGIGEGSPHPPDQ